MLHCVRWRRFAPKCAERSLERTFDGVPMYDAALLAAKVMQVSHVGL